MAALSPRNVRRRENLRELVTRAGGVNEAARLIRTPASHLSAILASGAGVGDALAAKVEKTFSLFPGALDLDPAAKAAIPEIDEVAQALNRMVRAKRMSQEEVAGMLQQLLAREKLSRE